MLKVVCFGEVLVDFIPDDAGLYTPHAGGAPANVAVAVAKLGGNSRFVGGISTDSMGNMLEKSLVNYGVDTDSVIRKSNKTALVLISLDGDGERSFEFYRDNTADLAINSADVNSLSLKEAGFLHLCSNTLTTNTLSSATYSLISNAKASNVLVSCDVNLRLNLWPAGTKNKEIATKIDQCLAHCDVIKFSKDELVFLAAHSDQTESDYLTSLLEKGVSGVFVTDGPNPIQYISPNVSVTVTPKNAEAVDTTAAGDSFVGGVLYKLCQAQSEQQITASLKSEKQVSEIIDFASRCGAYTVTQRGAFDALPTSDQLLN